MGYLDPYTGPALAPYQAWINGLLVGDGTAYDIVQLEGIDALPPIPQPDLKIDQAVGMYLGSYFPSGREIAVELAVHDDVNLRSTLDALSAATVPQPLTEVPFAWMLPGQAHSRQAYVRPAARANPINVDYVFGKATVLMHLFATDPRMYDTNVHTAAVPLPSGTGGAAWPWSWPVSWGSSATGGIATLNNAGGFDTRPIITLTGPLDNPTIQNLTTGGSATFALSLSASDVLTVDMHAPAVRLNGTGNLRYTMVSGSFWGLAPGDNLFQYTAATVHTGSVATVRWASARI